MDVLIVTGIFPPDIGGPATYVPMIAAGLASRGHRIRVLTWADRITDQHDVLSYELSRIPRNSLRSIRGVRTVWRIARLGMSSDVLFVCGLSFYAALANIFLRKPLVMRIVGDLAWERSMALNLWDQDFETFQRARHPLRIRLVQWLQDWWLHKADLIIVPSQYLLRWIAGREIVHEKIAVIHNAVEPAERLEPQRIALETEVKLITAGRLISLKRVEGIIAALAELDAVGLVVVGEGPVRPELEQLASRLGVRDRVFFAGQRDNRGLRRLMEGCDIFVLNSLHEGFPFVLLEAMSVGLPVVAHAVGGIPEIVDNERTGLLVDGSSGQLVGALRRLTESHELRRRLGQDAREVVRSRFCVQDTLNRTEKLLAGMRMGAVR